MVKARSPWRALRTVLLAGAAALTWLTFSSPAASADELSDTTARLGGVTSSVSSVTDKPVGPAGAATASPSAAEPLTGLLEPVVGQLSGPADNIVSADPVVNQVITAGTVAVVSAPVAGVADGATAAVVEVVVPPVAEAVPALEPVLQPVSDLVAGSAPLPVVVPELPVVPVGADPSEGAVVPTHDYAADGDSDAMSLSPPPAGVPVSDAVGEPGFAASPVGPVALASSSSALWASIAASRIEAAFGVAVEQQDSAGPSPIPAQAPAPGSGAGSGNSMSGSSASAAWLSPFTFGLPIAGAVRAGKTSEHVPAPVSFDPGSSPD